MDHLHPALGDDNLIKMLLYDNDLLHDKRQSQHTNVHCLDSQKNSKNFFEANPLNHKKNPFRPVCFLYIDNFIITIPVVN